MKALIIAINLLCGVSDLGTPELVAVQCVDYYINCTIEGAGTWTEEKLLECKNDYTKKR